MHYCTVHMTCTSKIAYHSRTRYKIVYFPCLFHLLCLTHNHTISAYSCDLIYTTLHHHHQLPSTDDASVDFDPQRSMESQHPLDVHIRSRSEKFSSTLCTCLKTPDSPSSSVFHHLFFDRRHHSSPHYHHQQRRHPMVSTASPSLARSRPFSCQSAAAQSDSPAHESATHRDAIHEAECEEG